MKEISFKWSNYLKPTPTNLKMFMEFFKGFVLIITSSAAFNGASPWTITLIAAIGYILDRLAKFFGYVADHETQVTITIPGDVKDQVTMTKEVTDGK